MEAVCWIDRGFGARLITRSLPPAFARHDVKSRSASPLYSAPFEQIYGTEMLIRMLVHGRRLFLATVSGTTLDKAESLARGQALRRPLMQAAKETVQSCIQLGMTARLEMTDIREPY